MIYGNYTPRSTVVLFKSWGGIQPSSRYYRIGITGLENCSRAEQVGHIPDKISESIVLDSQRYKERYMPQAKSSGYVSILLRMEWYAINHGFQNIKSSEKKKKLQMLTECVNSINTYVDRFKEKYKIKSVFLAMDCRKQGSDIFRANSSNLFSKELVDKTAATLYQKLYGNSSSLEEWDESFDSIASFKTPGYISQLQKYLAYSGTCLLTAGGGSFQRTAMELYKKRHSNHCAIKIPNC